MSVRGIVRIGLAVNSTLVETRANRVAKTDILPVSSVVCSARMSGLTTGSALSSMMLIHPPLHLMQVLRGLRFCKGPVPTLSHFLGPGIRDSKVWNQPTLCSWYFASDGRISPKLSGQIWPLLRAFGNPQNAHTPRGFDMWKSLDETKRCMSSLGNSSVGSLRVRSYR